jgi:hypothetical protein
MVGLRLVTDDTVTIVDNTPAGVSCSGPESSITRWVWASARQSSTTPATVAPLDRRYATCVALSTSSRSKPRGSRGFASSTAGAQRIALCSA